MEYKTILYTKSPPLARITLNRPEALNAINDVMLKEIIAVCRQIADDSEVRVVVFDSACGRAFSAGIDVDFVKDMHPWFGRWVPKLLHECFGTVRFIEKPFIAAIDGLCLGAGLELAVSCDILIATERSRFGLPNVHRGIPAIVEAAILPHAMSIFHVKEMAFTGEFWDAHKAERRGLLNVVTPDDDLQAEVDGWVEKLAAKPTIALATQKDIINKWMLTDLETAIDYSIQTVLLTFSTRDQKEGMKAFLEKREARFTGE
ncbi:MAG: enoyl-CoA hydratase/isomerase family protein [Anaerolineales bacterium]|nr:enoyl-CoA hydratase/isomerase family protein [Anaerolineales bacterium]